MVGLTRDHPETIAFVLACDLNGAITREETRDWVMRVIETVPDYPTYLLDLYDRWSPNPPVLLGEPKNVPFPFPMERHFSDWQQRAMRSIGYSRGFERKSYFPEWKARLALAFNPGLVREFKATFDWLNDDPKAWWQPWPNSPANV
ncbi:hypothetical protein [Terricaulis sp.]|uniref:hypothetical protein n=1 Tax=Terricaulis sp. TaxID=2768686 RepID=UPI002AC5D5ED|nr:hypothetical protein [Terricaulis sp.]MDZ4690694.1 hypothetical protein [Terricaulis sp.]